MLVYSQQTFADEPLQGKVYVAVASNFIKVFEQLKLNYNRQYPKVKIVSSYGSSGKLFAQLTHGAPFDLFLSADTDKPQKLVELGLVDRHAIYTYALGQLALVARKNIVLPKQALLDGQYGYLALANEKLAPYGLAAKQTMDYLALDIQRKKTVFGENISQTFRFFMTGHADLAFLAYAQVMDAQNLSVWLIPQAYYHPIEQAMVITKRAKNNQAAVSLFQFMQSQDAQCQIVKLGYKSQVCSH